MDPRALIAYVAEDRRHGAPQPADVARRTEGAALFADIVGFTPLTNALSRALGPRGGADQLTIHLNAVYDAVIAQIHRFGGAVIDFSGDAIMCWFDDRGVPADGTRRAVTAATELTAVMASLDELELPDGDRVRLAMKVAVACGAVTRLASGDPVIRRVDVIAGPAIMRTAEAEKVAEHREIVLDQSVLDQLGDALVLGERRKSDAGRTVAVLDRVVTPAPPAPWPEPRPAGEVAEWLDHRVRARADGGATELRPIVAVFLKFGAFDFDATDAAPRFDAFIRCVQRTLAPFDGNLMQVTTGDKGNYLYVAFGAPTAHEDLADRAVGAALELRRVVVEQGFVTDPAIGIDHGIARVGAYGGAGRRTYGALGDATNMAARLMSAARAGEILVTEATRAATRERLTFDQLAPMRVKGRGDPIAVARLVGRPVGTAHRPFGELVGRGAELDRLIGLVGGIEHGPAGVAVVEGEPGIGKSHLVDTVRHRIVERLDVTWLSVGAEGSRHGSLDAFMPLLRDLFYQDLAETDDARESLFDQCVDVRLAELNGHGHPLAEDLARAITANRSYLAALLGIRRPGSAFERHEPSTRLARAVQTAAAYLESESMARPLVLHVRDAHLLDPDARALVELLVPAAERLPISVILDRRPAPDAIEVPADRVVALTPLGPDDATDLIQVLTGAPPSPELVEHVWTRSAGNALFTEQLVIDLQRRGAVVVDERGRAELIELGHEIPSSLDAVLLSRLDHLSPELQQAAQAAAVLGPSFEAPDLAGLLAGPGVTSGVDAVLGAGEAAGLWSGTDAGPYRFRHALLRDAAYQMQVAETRRHLHRTAARVIARRCGRAEDSVGFHWEQAGAGWRAAAAYRRSARRAAAAARLRDASARLDAAIEQAQRADAPIAVLARLHDEAAEVAAGSGAHGAAADHLATVIGRYATGTDPRLPSWRARRGEALHRLGRIDEAEVEFERAIDDLQAHPSEAVASRIYAGLAMVHLGQGELDEAVDLAELAILFAAGDDSAGSRARHHLGIIRTRRGEYEQALELCLAAIDSCERRGDLGGRAAVLNNLGTVHLALGDLDAAVDSFSAAVTEFDRTGNEHGLANALDNLAQTLVERGEQEAAMPHLERAVEILARIGIGPDGVVAAMWQSGSW